MYNPHKLLCTKHGIALLRHDNNNGVRGIYWGTSTMYMDDDDDDGNDDASSGLIFVLTFIGRTISF